MTQSDLRAAALRNSAERVLESNGWYCDSQDAKEIAEHVLEIYPPDGETEIDEAWLVSVGGDNKYDAGCVTFASEHGDTIAWLRSVSRVFVNGRGLHKPVITRSALHRLCAALGISLKEENTSCQK